MKEYKIIGQAPILKKCKYTTNLIGSSCCTHECEYSSNYEISNEDAMYDRTITDVYFKFTCNHYNRKEKLKILKIMTDNRFEEYKNKENKEILDSTYNDYHSDEIQNNKKHKSVFINQIILMVTYNVTHGNCSINDWLDKFKDDNDMLIELKKITI